MTLYKLAVKRDLTVPMGVRSPLHLDCPCGTVVPVEPAPQEVLRCRGCGAEYDRAGWRLRPPLTTDEHRKDTP